MPGEGAREGLPERGRYRAACSGVRQGALHGPAGAGGSVLHDSERQLPDHRRVVDIQ